MAYRKPTPPVKSDREQQLEALTKRGAAVLQRQEEAQQRAQLEAKHAEERYALSREAGRNREIGRLNRPWLGATVAIGVMTPVTAAGLYGFLHSGIFIALWIHMLLWGVMVPAVGVALLVERFLAARLGISDRQATRAWTDSLPFLLTGYETDFRHNSSSFVLRFRFEAATPEPDQLVQVLAGVDEKVVVKLAEYPAPPGRESDDEISINELGADDGPQTSDDGSFALAISHRNRRSCRTWLPGWAISSAREALEPLHALYALASVEFVS